MISLSLIVETHLIVVSIEQCLTLASVSLVSPLVLVEKRILFK